MYYYYYFYDFYYNNPDLAVLIGVILRRPQNALIFRPLCLKVWAVVAALPIAKLSPNEETKQNGTWWLVCMCVCVCVILCSPFFASHFSKKCVIYDWRKATPQHHSSDGTCVYTHICLYFRNVLHIFYFYTIKSTIFLVVAIEKQVNKLVS